MNYLYKFYINCLLLLLFSSPFLNAQIEWTKLPQPYGGWVNALYAKGDTIFAGVQNTFYISTNGGGTWFYSGIESKGYFLNFVHTNSNTYFANCAEGLYKSNDLRNWSRFDSTEYESLSRDDDGNIYAVRGHQVLMSTDNLNTWKQIFYIPVYYFPRILTRDGYVFVTGQGVIYRKYIGEFTSDWTYLQMPYLNPVNLTTGPGNLIYSISNSPDLLGVTSDYGETWSFVDIDSYFPGMTPDRIAVIDSAIVMTGSILNDTNQVRLFRSTNSGKSWTTANAALSLTLSAGVLLSSNGNFYAATSGAGVYKSADKGETWLPAVTGMSETDMGNAVISSDGTEIFTTVLGEGIVRSTDNGLTWTSFNKGLNDVFCSDLVKDMDEDLFMISRHRTFRLADHNQDSIWMRTSTLNIDFSKLWVDPYGRLWAFWGNSVLRSDNDGKVWYDIFTPQNYVSGMVISRQWNIYLTTSNPGKIYKSVDDGYHWTVNYEHFGIMMDIMMDRHGYLFVPGYLGSIYRSTNEGYSWEILTNRLTHYNVYKTFTDKQRNLYCTVKHRMNQTHHLLRSTDLGETWEIISGNLDIYVYDMKFIDDRILLFTNKGLWVNSFNTSAVEDNEIPNSFLLEQNYPNPFNPATTIIYSVPNTSTVTLKVYDILGRETAVLVNEEKQPGSYEVTWNASALPSGIYFYRLKSNGAVITKKMTLIK